jgi:tryptophanyl-tRNA synthetase
VELTRDLAQRFNATYGPTFTVPGLVPDALSARVRDLAEPARKMSKSAPADAPGVIRILDSADVLRRKIRRAVTDSDNELRYDPSGKPGLANLAEITAILTGTTPAAVLAAATSYGQLKDTCADAVDAELAPVRQRHDELIANPDELRRRLDLGAAKASAVANPVLLRARQALGV